MTDKKVKSGTIDVKALLAGDEEFLRALVRTALQEGLEAEMTEAWGAENGERAAGRQGYRSGSYGRTLITRVGKLELRVPQDRTGRFSTELFERYQRSARARGSLLWTTGTSCASSGRNCRFSHSTACHNRALSRQSFGTKHEGRG